MATDVICGFPTETEEVQDVSHFFKILCTGAGSIVITDKLVILPALC